MTIFYKKVLPVIFILAIVSFCGSTYAADALSVEEAVVCEGVEDRAPVSAGTSFPITVDRLYLFTKVVGAETPTEVTHV